MLHAGALEEVDWLRGKLETLETALRSGSLDSRALAGLGAGDGGPGVLDAAIAAVAGAGGDHEAAAWPVAPAAEADSAAGEPDRTAAEAGAAARHGSSLRSSTEPLATQPAMTAGDVAAEAATTGMDSDSPAKAGAAAQTSPSQVLEHAGDTPRGAADATSWADEEGRIAGNRDEGCSSAGEGAESAPQQDSFSSQQSRSTSREGSSEMLAAVAPAAVEAPEPRSSGDQAAELHVPAQLADPAGTAVGIIAPVNVNGDLPRQSGVAAVGSS